MNALLTKSSLSIDKDDSDKNISIGGYFECNVVACTHGWAPSLYMSIISAI